MTKYSYVDDLDIMRFVKHDNSDDSIDYDDVLLVDEDGDSSYTEEQY